MTIRNLMTSRLTPKADLRSFEAVRDFDEDPNIQFVEACRSLKIGLYFVSTRIIRDLMRMFIDQI